MTPLPKRKHSKARKGRRLAVRKKEHILPQLVKCVNCGRKKLPKQQCKNCQK